MAAILGRMWLDDDGDIAEYAVMLAVILVIVVGSRALGFISGTIVTCNAVPTGRVSGQHGYCAPYR
jgi:hypothetical protein